MLLHIGVILVALLSFPAPAHGEDVTLEVFLNGVPFSDDLIVSNFGPLVLDFTWNSTASPLDFETRLSCEALGQVEQYWIVPEVGTNKDRNNGVFEFPFEDLYACTGQPMQISIFHTLHRNLTTSSEIFDTSFILIADSLDISNTAIICNTLSLIASAGCMFLYLRFSSLRRFPSVLVFWKVCVGFFMAITFLTLELRKRSPMMQSEACLCSILLLHSY